MKLIKQDIYYIDYSKNNDFSGNVGSVFFNGKDITESILPKLDKFRNGIDQETRFNTDNRIVLKTIYNLMSMYGKCNMRTSKEYVANILNGINSIKHNIQLAQDTKKLYELTESEIVWEK